MVNSSHVTLSAHLIGWGRATDTTFVVSAGLLILNLACTAIGCLTGTTFNIRIPPDTGVHLVLVHLLLYQYRRKIQTFGKYEVRCSFLDMLSLRLSIPLGWRQSISAGWSPEPTNNPQPGPKVSLPNEQPLDILNVSPRQLYRAFVAKMNHTSTAYRRWRESRNHDFEIADMEEWRDVTTNVYKATRETKLKILHFKIINWIIPCGTYLQQLRILQDDLCAFCGLQDSLPHFFYDCARNKPFWQAVCRWFEGVEDLRLTSINCKHFLFGIPQLDPKGKKINAILISVKFYIHRQRLFHQGQFELVHWLREFRSRLLVEREILGRERRLRCFTPWKRILEAMG